MFSDIQMTVVWSFHCWISIDINIDINLEGPWPLEWFLGLSPFVPGSGGDKPSVEWCPSSDTFCLCVSFLLYLFFVVVEVELRTLCSIGRCSTTWVAPPALLWVLCVCVCVCVCVCFTLGFKLRASLARQACYHLSHAPSLYWLFLR
jgi:hypothetical protein